MELYRDFLKYLFDFCVSIILFLFLSPFFLLITLLLLLVNNGEPFFFQNRPGKHCKVFKVIKFKTMNDRRNARGELLPDAERITPIGKFIRKTSLDEISQLLNVIKGDMSLIGPRPLLTEYLHLYNIEQNRRHEIRPGITGWAQVNGRNTISWEKKFEYDVWYVENMSFILDMKILWMTIINVFKSEGISAEGQATMEKFKGSAK